MLIVGYLIVDSLLFDGIKPKAIQENGFQASYYSKEDTKNKAAVILLGGGQWEIIGLKSLLKKDL